MCQALVFPMEIGMYMGGMYIQRYTCSGEVAVAEEGKEVTSW